MFNYLFLSAANWPSCSTVDRGYFKPGPTHLVFNINKNIFYFFQMTPSHIEVNRCAGGCNHRQQSCLPTRVRKKKIPVSTQNSLNSLFICSRYFVKYYGRSELPIMKVPISVMHTSSPNFFRGGVSDQNENLVGRKWKIGRKIFRHGGTENR